MIKINTRSLCLAIATFLLVFTNLKADAASVEGSTIKIGMDGKMTGSTNTPIVKQ